METISRAAFGFESRTRGPHEQVPRGAASHAQGSLPLSGSSTTANHGNSVIRCFLVPVCSSSEPDATDRGFLGTLLASRESSQRLAKRIDRPRGLSMPEEAGCETSDGIASRRRATSRRRVSRSCSRSTSATLTTR